jgi:hypothetical protein
MRVGLWGGQVWRVARIAALRSAVSAVLCGCFWCGLHVEARGTSEARPNDENPRREGRNRSKDRVRHNPPESGKFEGNVEGGGSRIGAEVERGDERIGKGEKKRSGRRNGRRWRMDGRLVRKR